MATRPDVVAAAARLRAAVEETAAALATADLDRLLAANVGLQTVLDERPWPAAVEPTERPGARRELEAAHAALLRCRRLGGGLNDFIRLSFEARGHWPGYEPVRTAAAALTGRGFNQRG